MTRTVPAGLIGGPGFPANRNFLHVAGGISTCHVKWLTTGKELAQDLYSETARKKGRERQEQIIR